MSERSERIDVATLRKAPTERSEGVHMSERSERIDVAALREAPTERSEGVR
jgi:hypothetical protein